MSRGEPFSPSSSLLSFKKKKDTKMSEKEDKKPFVRLPTDVIPTNYAVQLTPDLEKFTFNGIIDIDLKVNKSTKSVLLNCADIEIFKVSSGEQAGSFSFCPEDETVTLTFPQELTSASPIHIEYKGILNDEMKGFYRSKYTHPDQPGVEKYAAVTQFEPADARRALPCWDEPAHKATFDVTLTVPKHLVALSNMDVKEETESGNTKTLVFNRTPIMSTYLLAFVVGEYDYIEERDSNGVLVRVYTPLGKKEQGRFALNIAVKTIPFYTEYFKVPYPLPKIDLIAIADFAAGAMENWGLVTYRERLLLADENSPISSKQIVAIVVGHELAHQWFGNLVTMEWWTDLWLNEGFASWIEYLCVDYCHPEYEIWTQFLAQDYSQALSLDALSNSHPIEVPVGPPSEVEEIFDTISYNKGASVIRMLHHWIGDDDFRKGMNHYLNKFKYKNTVTNDLWESLGGASGKPVSTVMASWTQQMGYPVLTVDTIQEGTNRVVTISQQKFCADGSIKGFEDAMWQVPVTIATAQNQEAYKFLLDKRTATITIEGLQPNDWIKVNPGQYGFYRVNYSSQSFTPLLTALSEGSTLSPQDRLGLLNDAFALARAGVGNTVDVLRLFKSFSQETNFTVWQNLVSSLSILQRLSTYSDFNNDFKRFAQTLFAPSLARLGWTSSDTDSPLDTMLRSLILKQCCNYGNKETIAEAQSRFAAHVNKTSLIPADLKDLIYGTCMGNGDDTTFDQLIKLHDDTDDSDEKGRIYRSLGRGKTESLIRRCLEFGLLEDKVRNQDAWGPIYSASTGSRLGREITWNSLKSNWDIYKEKFKGSFLLSRVIEVVTIGFIGEDRATEIEEFFKANPVPVAERVIRQSLEAIRNNTKWLERDGSGIGAWLKEETAASK